ncbi:putative phospholipid:diacylglycerol acyltransferase 2 isoform X2 [Euphorbia lathyris]|uniref:putative phospholipid:diacylglycerol acyltransferase 2 isoform X2 n=1 Tax=Euphorbia lathyris TaxID=212925 RepID=UPI003313C8F1
MGNLKPLSYSMALILRFRKLLYVVPVNFSETKKIGKEEDCSSPKVENKDGIFTQNEVEINKKRKKRKLRKEWGYVDFCCWMIGYLCTSWWLLVFLYHCLPATLPGFQVPESPGVRLKREGLMAQHPVVLVPGIITGGLELWEGKPCAHGLFRQRLWGGTFTEMFKRPLCWLDHLSLDNETGLDPPGIRVRAVPGLVAADYFAPGYFVWAVLIENLARIGYEGKNLHMAAYDWRLSFQNTEIRDQALSRLKSKIELMYVTNGYKKVVVVPHSMGVVYFLHFLKWVETPPPVGGGGGPGWCNKYIKSIMNIGPTFLGVPKTISNLLSAEGKDVAFIRAMFPGILDSEILRLQTLEHVLRVSRTWDSTMSLMPKGGETIWGNLDWSPEERHVCDLSKKTYRRSSVNDNTSDVNEVFQVKKSVKYGRIISFSKSASELPSSQLPSINSKRAEAHFSHGIADNLDDPKYKHYKYWSNPLETRLPDAPDMEIYCSYGVGMPTERSYVFKLSPTNRCKSIPFRIDTAVNGEEDSCLKNGVHFVDGDESVPVISAGYMCAKGWRGKTRFNPSGSRAFIREYKHKPPSSLLEGRGIESGSHVDIMGNFGFIEDVLRVAAGATGPEIGGDRIHSDILRMSEKVKLQL